MKLSINTNLLNLLVSLDFLLIPSNNKILNLRYVQQVKGLNKENLHYQILDILEIIKSIKQLIRLFQFLNTKNSSVLQICTLNKQTLNLLKFYLKTHLSNSSVSLSTSLTNKKKINKDLKLLLMLEEPLKNNKNIFKNLIEENIFIINKWNNKIEKNNWGTYKVYNDLSDFKKIIFLISLIRQTLIIK
jgi:hypothetical protein